MAIRVFAVGVLGCLLLVGCDRPTPSAVENVEVVPAVAPVPDREFTLPRSPSDALFVWVKSDGDFQTTASIESIPAESRKKVRVIHPEHPSSPTTVWLADVSMPGDAITAKSVSRAEWESLGAKERSARVEAATPKEEEAPDASALSGVSATLYGASWCHACKSAEAYLRGKGVPLVKKDIEEDPSAQAEMSAKLRRAGQGGSSIPVIDIAGTVMVGFSEAAINTALNRALKK